MSLLQVPKKIRAEDFKAADQALITKIAYIYNDFVDSVYQILNKQVDYANLNRQIIVATINLDKTGAVQQNPTYKTTINGKVGGLTVLRAVNVNDTSIFPAGAPWISWSYASNQLKILDIKGLVSNPTAASQWQLTFELVVTGN